MDTSAVPLMMDMEGGEGEDKRAGVEAGLEGDFAYHNNVAGASKHVRLGGCQHRITRCQGHIDSTVYVFPGFMRKVYGLLAVQLSITTLIGAVFLFTPGVKEFVQVRSPRTLCQYLMSNVTSRANPCFCSPRFFSPSVF